MSLEELSNDDIEQHLDFKYAGFSFFLDRVTLSASMRNTIHNFLKAMKRLPASTNQKYHGFMKGGYLTTRYWSPISPIANGHKKNNVMRKKPPLLPNLNFTCKGFLCLIYILY